MKWCVKESNDYNLMIWKNGKGKSSQLHIEPTHCTLLEPFEWRISSATIQHAGPFSTFEGYTRSIVLLKGSKLALFHQQQPNICIQLRHLKPYSFNGGWNTDSIFQSHCPNGDCNSLINAINNTTLNTKDKDIDSLQVPQIITPSSSSSDTSSSSSMDLSPVLTRNQQQSSPPQMDEATDFNVFTKDSVCDQICKILDFNGKENTTSTHTLSLVPEKPENHNNHYYDSEVPSPSSSDQSTTKYYSSSVVLYAFGGDFIVSHEGLEGSTQKFKILNGQTLIVQDIQPTHFSETLKVDSISSFEHHLIVAHINYKVQK